MFSTLITLQQLKIRIISTYLSVSDEKICNKLETFVSRPKNAAEDREGRGVRRTEIFA